MAYIYTYWIIFPIKIRKKTFYLKFKDEVFFIFLMHYSILDSILDRVLNIGQRSRGTAIVNILTSVWDIVSIKIL